VKGGGLKIIWHGSYGRLARSCFPLKENQRRVYQYGGGLIRKREKKEGGGGGLEKRRFS